MWTTQYQIPWQKEEEKENSKRSCYFTMHEMHDLLEP